VEFLGVEDLEIETELDLKLALPLIHDSGRGDDKHPRGAAAGGEVPEDQTSFDGFAEADIVRQEQARAWKLEGAHGRDVLVGFEADARAAGADQEVVRRREFEFEGVVEKPEAGQPAWAVEREVGNLVGLDEFERGQDDDVSSAGFPFEAAKQEAG
jgi:hypothetical protein